VSNAIFSLARAFWEICFLRRGPQDLPASESLMWSTLAVYTVAGLIILSFDYAAGAAIPGTIADALFLWGSTALLLRLYGRPLRTRQTVTAMAGAGVVLSLLALPIIAWWNYGEAQNVDVAVPGMLWLLLLGWSVVVSARILQQALSSSFFLGLTIALTFILIDQWVISLFLPHPPTGS
jgi:hypothetical protein